MSQLPEETPLSEKRLGNAIDLHIHTTASDGSLSPAECVDEAARLGLAAMAVTDHDTMAGNAEAVERGAARGVEVIPGVEISATLDRWSVHILGYWPQGTDALREMLAALRAGRGDRNPRILQRLAELGCPLLEEEVQAEAGSEVIGRPHIAAAMVRRGHVDSVQEAFNRYLGSGGEAYVPRKRPEAREAVGVLRDAGAVPVLAHPGASDLASAEEAAAIVAQLMPHGLSGIEVYYPSHSTGQTAAYQRIARDQGLVETGGTDFHGASKPDIRMGSGFGNLRVPRELLARLAEERERIRSREQALGH